MSAAYAEVEKLLYSKADAAHALSISERSVSYLIANKKLAFRKLGKRTLIPASEIRRFAAANHFDDLTSTLQVM